MRGAKKLISDREIGSKASRQSTITSGDALNVVSHDHNKIPTCCFNRIIFLAWRMLGMLRLLPQKLVPRQCVWHEETIVKGGHVDPWKSDLGAGTLWMTCEIFCLVSRVPVVSIWFR